jgi:hypothetical protein
MSTPAREVGREGPFGTVHGGAVGRIWDIGHKIVLEAEGVTLVAGLLESEAPKTCEAFLSILPFEGDFVSLRWSGDGMQTHDKRLEDMTDARNLTLENFTLIAARGDILFWPRDRGLFICYNYMYSKGITGEEPSNLFAHVLPEYYPALYDLGKKIYVGGARRIKFRVSPADQPK